MSVFLKHALKGETLIGVIAPRRPVTSKASYLAARAREAAARRRRRRRLGISSAGVLRRFQNIPIIPAGGGRRAGRSHGIWLKGAPDLSSPWHPRCSVSPFHHPSCCSAFQLSSLSLSRPPVPLAASLVFTPKCPMLHLSTRTYSFVATREDASSIMQGGGGTPPPPPRPSASHNGAALKSIPHFFFYLQCVRARAFVSACSLTSVSTVSPAEAAHNRFFFLRHY